jgi:hypothetical protein
LQVSFFHPPDGQKVLILPIPLWVVLPIPLDMLPPQVDQRLLVTVGFYEV